MSRGYVAVSFTAIFPTIIINIIERLSKTSYSKYRYSLHNNSLVNNGPHIAAVSNKSTMQTRLYYLGLYVCLTTKLPKHFSE